MSSAVPHYAGWERLVMRVLFALVVAHHIPLSLDYHSLPSPNGLARLVDLTFLLNPAVFAACRYAAYGLLVLYVARIGWSCVLPLLTLFSIAAGSVVNSQGAISHYLQIVALVLLAQTIAHFYNVLRKRHGSSTTDDSVDEDRVILASQQAIAATYLVSALSKLINSAGAWILQSPLIAVQIVKTTEQDFYDTLDPARAASGVAVADWMAHHPLIVGAVLTGGLLLELTAPLLLLGRGWAAAYGIALVAFHESVHRVMKLHFLYNEHLAWIYLVNVPFWIVIGARWFSRRRIRTASP